MTGFRGSNESLDREISTLEGMARLRLRRASRELRDLDRELRDLRKERARRRAAAEVPAATEPSMTEVRA